MRIKLHGLLSLLLIFLAWFLGFLFILEHSRKPAFLYLILVLLSIPIILYSYCAKCPCRLQSCGHVLPGLLTRFLPERKPGKYTFKDLSGFIIPVIVNSIFPQFWLRKDITFLIIFWLAFFTAVIEIRLYLCKSCDNNNCPLYCKKH